MMNRIIRPYLLLIFYLPLFLFTNCKSSRDITVIDLNREDKISVLDIVDSINVVQLETNPECLISVISKVIPYKDRYYILDNRRQEIFCFNQQGRFLFKIAKRGRGPEEYTYLGDFNIDPFNEQLLILVPFGEILYFDSNGQFLWRTSLPKEIKAYNEVHIINKDELFFVSASQYGAVFYSRLNNKITKTMFPKTPECLFFPLLYTYNDSIYFSPAFDNTILCASKDFKQQYTWNFGEFNTTPAQIEAVNTYVQIQSKKGRLSVSDMIVKEKLLHYYIYNNAESSRYRMALLESESGMKAVMNDKKTGKNIIFSKTIESVNFVFNGLHKDTLILWDLGNGNTYYAKELLSPDQFEKIRIHKDTDNPLLVIYQLKR
jgi:6-bladed beta-propeller